MKKLSILILSVVLVFGLAFTGCDKTPTEGSFTESGYLDGPEDSYTFTLDAGTDTFVELPFEYPKGSADFWVKVVGKDGVTVLGEFDLDEGEIIQLSGGSVFFVTIYSKDGEGSWSTDYVIGNNTTP